jgi:peptidoglycan/xylan/chitin deacetylase (PgdA/CDA1 family)
VYSILRDALIQYRHWWSSKIRRRTKAQTPVIAVILLYHSIADRGDRPDHWELSVSPDNFFDQMRILSAERSIVSLEDLAGQLNQHSLRARTVALTFDDGYANNLHTAKPVLDHLGLTATLFLTTGALGTSEFWWDRLERIIADARFRPSTLKLNLVSETLELQPESWDDGKLLTTMWSILRDVHPEVRADILATLEERLAVKEQTRFSRPLRVEEVWNLRATIRVGVHTITHPWLPALSESELARELSESKSTCEAISGYPATAFSYPFGVYDETTRSAVVECGFHFACATKQSIVTPDSDIFGLPRIAAPNVSGLELLELIDRIAAGRLC